MTQVWSHLLREATSATDLGQRNEGVTKESQIKYDMY